MGAQKSLLCRVSEACPELSPVRNVGLMEQEVLTGRREPPAGASREACNNHLEPGRVRSLGIHKGYGFRSNSGAHKEGMYLVRRRDLDWRLLGSPHATSCPTDAVPLHPVYKSLGPRVAMQGLQGGVWRDDAPREARDSS